MFFVINPQNVVELLMHGRGLTNMCVVEFGFAFKNLSLFVKNLRGAKNFSFYVKNLKGSRRWWCMLLIPALQRERQVNLCEFKDSLVYRANFRAARAT